MITILLLWLTSAVLAAEAALDLSDPWQQLAFTRELAKDPVFADEAAVSLMALRELETIKDPASSELYLLAVKEDTHPGWRDIYNTLLSAGGLSAEGRLAVQIRVAEALVGAPETRARAVASLQGLVAANPQRTDARLALARALMVDQRPDEARAIFLGTTGGAVARRGALVALVALGRLEDAEVLVDGLRLETDSPLRRALDQGSLATRAAAVGAEGYPELAAWAVAREDPRASQPDAWRALAEVQLRAGQPGAAARSLATAVENNPDRPELRELWTAALLEAGDLEGAREAAGSQEAALQQLYAVQLVTDEAGAAAGRAGEVERAYRLAPRQPQVLQLYAEQLLAAGEGEAAREAVAAALETRPNDEGLLALYVRAALAADAPGEALAAHRASILALSDLDRFWERAGALAGLYSQVAEHYKARGQTDKALWHYRVALAMRPDAWEYYSGIGGVYWSAGDLRAARAAYREAYNKNPDELGALQGLVGITLAMGKPRDALAVLDESTLQAPQLLELREQARIALLLEDIIYALDAGLEEDAMRSYRDLLVRYPDNPRILHSLGDALMRGDKPAEALEAYQQARAFDPNNAWLALAEANAQIELGRMQWAQDVLEEIRPGEDEDLAAEVRRVQARVLRSEGDRLWHDLGRDREAFDLYARALELDLDPWTLTAVGGLYLEHGQPSVAQAFFEDALARDPDNQLAALGRIRSLQALGELDAARAGLEGLDRGAADEEAWAVQESMEIQAAIAEVDRLRLAGDSRRAQAKLEDIGRRYPDSPHVDAAMGSLYLDQEQPRKALQYAERALDDDPTHGRALVVAMEAGLALARMSEVLVLFERAQEVGGGERARLALDNAQFAASVEQAAALNREGRWKEGRDKLDELAQGMADNPDHWALLAGGYLALGLNEDARAAYDQALEIDAEHIPSLIGVASVEEARGFLTSAERWLSDQFDRTEDASVGLQLARVQGRLGRWRAGMATLERVRQASPVAAEPMGWAAVKPLPVLPLSDGSLPEDLPPAVTPGVASGVALQKVDALEAQLGAAHYPYGDIGGGSLGRTGEEGFNWMTSAVVTASVSEIYAGPVRLLADVVTVYVDDGVNTQDGLGASAGFATPADRRIGLEARAGTSPIGFDAGSYVTWKGVLKLALDPRVEVAGDTGRVPVTDSLLSWAGRFEDGTPYGLVSYTWGGGWLSLNSPSLADGGVRVRVGTLGGLAMDPVSRREFTGWAGQRMGTDDFSVRIGGNFTWLTHSEQIDGFEVGQAGVFTPRRFTSGLVRGDLLWTPDFSTTTLCGGAAIGMQSIDTQDSLYSSAGTFRAFAAGAGLRFPLTDDWQVAIDARTESTGSDWSQQSILFRLGYLPPWTELQRLKNPSESHGTGIANMSACAG